MVVILYNECYYFFISIVKFKQFDLSKSENCISLDGGSSDHVIFLRLYLAFLCRKNTKDPLKFREREKLRGDSI